MITYKKSLHELDLSHIVVSPLHTSPTVDVAATPLRPFPLVSGCMYRDTCHPHKNE